MRTKEAASQTPFHLPIREDLAWDFSRVPRRIVEGDILVNYLWMGMSLGAPGIERFFIKALRPLAGQIDDDKLREDMDRMIVQEGMHSAAHAEFNKHLASLGIDVPRVYAEIDELLDWVADNNTVLDMTGMVSAGEHMLYSFAVVFLNNAEIRASISPEARRLFEYHLLEEAEHGAVSHDIYRYFCGDNYWHRVKTAMRASRAVTRLISRTITTLAEEGGEKITWRNWLALMRYGFLKPGLFRLMIARFLQYLSPGYRLTFTHEDLETLKGFERNLYATQPGQR
jgi:uncharacterized protein